MTLSDLLQNLTLRRLMVYAGLALVVMGPLLGWGYILTFDMPWTPHLVPPTHWDSNSMVVFWVLYVVSLVIPSMLLQKLMLIGILVGAALGGHVLARRRVGETAAYLAGVFMMINPYMYTRLMAGQFLVMAGLALLPWVAWSWQRLLERPGRRSALRAGGVLVLLGLVSIHTVGMAAVLVLVQSLAFGWGRWERLRAVWPWALGVAGGWLVLNANWMVPLLVGTSPQAHQIAVMDVAQAEAFATQSGAGGALLTVATLGGFWADHLGRYVLASSTGVWFWLGWVFLGGLVVAGFVQALRRRHRLELALGISGIIGYVVALGLATPVTAVVFTSAITHLPLVGGYREPQKWAAVLVVAQAVLAAGGLHWVAERLRGLRREAVLGGALLLPLIITPMMLVGAGGQLRAVDYPQSWYELSERLQGPGVVGSTLMLPWHQYLRLGFVGRVVANPAPAFFPGTIISSANPEQPGVPDGADPGGVAAAVGDKVLAERFTSTELAGTMRGLGIGQVVVVKESDWQDYDWVAKQPGLKLVAETDAWQLWQVESNQ